MRRLGALVARLSPGPSQPSDLRSRVVEIETQLAERDAQLAERDAQLAERDAQLAGRDQQITALTTQLAEAMETNKRLELRVAKLEEQLGSNSTNSGKPPSSDAPKDREGRYPKRRRKSGRKRGGQKGHKGHHRALIPSDECDEIKDWYAESCKGCGSRLREDPESPFRPHQVTELPPVEPYVTEHRLHDGECDHCGRTTQCRLPAGVPTNSFGPRLTAVVALFVAAYRLSRRQVQSILTILFGVSMSLGTISKCEKRVSQAVAAPVDEAQRYIQHAAIKHIDATGWTQAGQRRQLWVMVTTLVTVFRIRLDGTMDTVKKLLGTPFGVLVSDRASVFGFWAMENRQVCWAHLMRAFALFSERGGKSTKTGDALTKQTRRMFKGWHRVRDGTLSREAFHVFMEPIQVETLRLLRQGADTKGMHAQTAGTCRELLKYRAALWTFVTVEGVEPTNNFAEQSVRHGVIWRRTSQGVNSDRGARFVERMMTVVMTLKKQGRDVLDYLTSAVQAAEQRDKAPSLLPPLS